MKFCLVDFENQFGCAGMKHKRPAIILKRSKKHYTVALLTSSPSARTKLSGYRYKDHSFDGWIKLDCIYIVDSKNIRKIYYSLDKDTETEIKQKLETMNYVKYFRNFDSRIVK